MLSPSNNNTCTAVADAAPVSPATHLPTQILLTSTGDDVSYDVMHGQTAISDNNNDPIDTVVAAAAAVSTDDDDDDDADDGRVMLAEQDADDFINNTSSSSSSSLPPPSSFCELMMISCFLATLLAYVPQLHYMYNYLI